MKTIIRSMFVALLISAFFLPDKSVLASEGSKLDEKEVITLIKQLQSEDDLAKAWEKLTDSEQKSINEYLIPTNIKTTYTTSTLPSPNAITSCTQAVSQVAAYNGSGNYRTWSYYNRVSWCFDTTNETVTSISAYAWGDVGNLSIGWTYQGEMTQWSSATPINLMAEHFSQGHFSFCTAACWTSNYPTLRSFAWYNGVFRFLGTLG